MVFQERQPLIKTGHGWWGPRAVNLMEERFGNRTAKSELVILVGDETEVCVWGGGLCSRMMLGAGVARELEETVRTGIELQREGDCHAQAWGFPDRGARQPQRSRSGVRACLSSRRARRGSCGQLTAQTPRGKGQITRDPVLVSVPRQGKEAGRAKESASPGAAALNADADCVCGAVSQNTEFQSQAPTVQIKPNCLFTPPLLVSRSGLL